VYTLGKDRDFVSRSEELKRQRGDLVTQYPGLVVIMHLHFQAHAEDSLSSLHRRLQKEFKITLSYNTLWRLAKLLFENLSPIIRPLHSAGQIAKRIEFCRSLIDRIEAPNSTFEDDILWTDEKKFYLRKIGCVRRLWVRIEPTAPAVPDGAPADATPGAAPADAAPSQCAQNKRIRYRAHGKSPGVMVWMGINAVTHCTVIHFVPVNETIDAEYHGSKIITACVVPAAQEFAKQTGGRRILLMQDNATVHKAAKLDPLYEKWERASAIDGGFTRLANWPPLSPDLNPIENVWAWLERRRPEVFSNVDQFKKWIIAEMDTPLGRVEVKKVCGSILRRAKEVLRTNGKATHY
jgi:hypothetical protein